MRDHRAGARQGALPQLAVRQLARGVAVQQVERVELALCEPGGDPPCVARRGRQRGRPGAVLARWRPGHGGGEGEPGTGVGQHACLA